MQKSYRFQIVLDMVVSQTRNRMNRISLQGPARREVQFYSLLSTVLTEVGPAGGNAEVRLYGAKRQLELYITEVYCKGDLDDAAFHIARITRYEGAAEQAVL